MSVMPSINVRLYREQLDWISDYGVEHEQTVSEVVRLAIALLMVREGAADLVDGRIDGIEELVHLEARRVRVKRVKA